MLKPLFLVLAIAAVPVFADEPVVENVTVTKSGDLWRFDVTIKHNDTGWDDYADAWRVLDGNGTELGLRKLAHPHTGEQPFTRSLSGVSIPSDVTEVSIQPRDTVNGWASATKKVKLR